MPTLGLLIMLNSGTYLSLLDPAAKTSHSVCNGTGNTGFSLDDDSGSLLQEPGCQESAMQPGRSDLIPQLIILILYIITFIYFLRLPLSRVIHAYVLATALHFSWCLF